MPLLLTVVALWLASIATGRDDTPDRDLCAASWRQADADGDGILEGREATPYLAMMYLNKATPPTDGRIDQARFVDACLAGSFRTGITAH